MIIVAQNPKDIKVDLSLPSPSVNFGNGKLIDKNNLEQKTVPQSFVLDYKGRVTNPATYIIQCTGGRTDNGRSTGELTLNKFNTSGNRTSIMQLNHSHSSSTPYEKDGVWYEGGSAKGFGHGSQIGIEYDSVGKTFYWTDINSPVTRTDLTDTDKLPSVFGMQLARFEYTANRLIKPHSDGVEWLHWKQLGLDADTSLYSNASVSIDNTNKRLAVKYGYCGVMYFAVYDMFYKPEYKTNPTITNIEFVLVSKSLAPKFYWWDCDSEGKCLTTKSPHISNGWALFGDFIYCGYSTGYFSKDSKIGQREFFSPTPEDVRIGAYYGDRTKATKAGNTHIITYDWKDYMNVVDENLTEAGKSLVYREMEGLFILPETDGCEVKSLSLKFIFAGGATGHRTWSMFEKTSKF